jgi:hypothetical protein
MREENETGDFLDVEFCAPGQGFSMEENRKIPQINRYFRRRLSRHYFLRHGNCSSLEKIVWN